MLGMLLSLLAVAAQDAAPPRTVEDRLKELEEKLNALEKKQQTLASENAALEKRLADSKAARETHARRVAAGWVKRYARDLELAEKQSAEVEELWFGWTREDFEKPPDAAKWGAREEALRGKLTPEQAGRLARKVREEQQQYARSSVSSILQMAKVAPERAEPFEKAVLGKLSFAEDILLPQAHPQESNAWVRVVSAVEKNMAEVSAPLNEEEQARLRDYLAKWKPRK